MAFEKTVRGCKNMIGRMKSYHALAWKEILEQKIVSALILTAIVLAAMMTTVVSQSAGVLSAMRIQQAITIGGNRYATFVQLTEEKAQILEKDSRLSYTGRYISLGSMEMNDLLSLSLVEYRKGKSGGKEMESACSPAYSHLIKGRLPESPMEIALPEDALQFLGFTGEIGDTIPLSLTCVLRHGIQIEAHDYKVDFVLTGITGSNYLGYTGGNILGLAGEGTADAALPPEYLYYNIDIRTVDKKGFQDVMDDLKAELDIHELDTLYNYPYLNALGIRYAEESDDSLKDTGFLYLLLAGILAAALVLTAAGLVVYNILKIAVTRRIGQYGMLRAIGARKGQLYRIVAKEVLLLCACGIPVGTLLGFWSAKSILAMALNQLSPEIFLTQTQEQLQELIAASGSGPWEYFLLSAFITLLFVFLAAAPAAWFAAKVPPVMAIYGRSEGKIRRKNRTIQNIKGFERYYAWLNLRRNRSRTWITILSLVMSITVFITLQSFLSLLSVAGAESEHLGDYSVVNEYSGFSPKELAKMEADQNVAAVAAQQFSLYELDEKYFPVGIDTDFALGIAEKFQIVGLNDCWTDHTFADRLTDEHLQMLKAGEGCVVRNPIPMEITGQLIGTTHIDVGSTITIAGRELPVLLSLSGYDSYFSIGNGGFINGVQVIVCDRLYPELTGTDVYAELRPIMAADADRETFDMTLDALCSRAAGTTWISYEQSDRQIEESAAQIHLLAWGLILFVGLIGILNIINTVYTNIHTRVAEIGIQRAIGMSVGSLYQTFLWEGFFYGVIATAVGSLAGYCSTMIVEAAVSNKITLVPMPIVPILEAALLSVTACLLATAIPLWRISRLNIVEAVGTVG